MYFLPSLPYDRNSGEYVPLPVMRFVSILFAV